MPLRLWYESIRKECFFPHSNGIFGIVRYMLYAVFGMQCNMHDMDKIAATGQRIQFFFFIERTEIEMATNIHSFESPPWNLFKIREKHRCYHILMWMRICFRCWWCSFCWYRCGSHFSSFKIIDKWSKYSLKGIWCIVHGVLCMVYGVYIGVRDLSFYAVLAYK